MDHPKAISISHQNRQTPPKNAKVVSHPFLSALCSILSSNFGIFVEPRRSPRGEKKGKFDTDAGKSR